MHLGSGQVREAHLWSPKSAPFTLFCMWLLVIFFWFALHWLHATSAREVRRRRSDVYSCFSSKMERFTHARLHARTHALSTDAGLRGDSGCNPRTVILNCGPESITIRPATAPAHRMTSSHMSRIRPFGRRMRKEKVLTREKSSPWNFNM